MEDSLLSNHAPAVPELKIRSYRHTYQVEFISDYLATLKGAYRANDFIIADEKIVGLKPALQEFLQDRRVIYVQANEASKSFAALGPVMGTLIEHGLTRSDRLLAIGGGVVQDITSFIASILYRGTPWLFFPTTLLTQCDSCIGSKTSINFGDYKNQLGSFFPPQNIFIDTTFLETLPATEKKSGLGEMLHYYLVTGEADLELVEAYGDQALVDNAVLQRFIHRSLAIKAAMIEQDEFDQGPRNVFNYGHSFGHALEAATGHQVPHGIAVAYGMDLANLISVQLGLIPMQLRNRIRQSLAKAFLAEPLPPVPIDAYLQALKKDKKNQGQTIKVILTRGLGAMSKETLPQSEAVTALIARFFAEHLYLAAQ